MIGGEYDSQTIFQWVANELLSFLELPESCMLCRHFKFCFESIIHQLWSNIACSVELVSNSSAWESGHNRLPISWVQYQCHTEKHVFRQTTLTTNSYNYLLVGCIVTQCHDLLRHADSCKHPIWKQPHHTASSKGEQCQFNRKIAWLFYCYHCLIIICV